MAARSESEWMRVLKGTAASVLVFPFLASGGVATTAQASEIAWVAIESTGAISAVDADSLEIVRHIDVGGRPHNLEVTADGLLVVATPGASTVAVVDPKTDPATINRIDLGKPPHDVAVGMDGHTAFVVSERGLLVRLDPKSGRVLRRTRLEGRPHDVAVWREAAWITDVSAGRIFVVDGERTQRLSISIEGHDLAVRPGSAELWVTPWRSDSLVIVDLNTRREVGGLQVGRTRSHKHVAFTNDGSEAWVTEPESGSLFVIDAGTRQVVERIDIQGHPHHVRFADGRAYVAMEPRNLVVLDVATHRIIGQAVVGAGVHDVGLLASR